jgi:hypothetical protein
MSDIEGKVATEAMSKCGQRASFNPFGVGRFRRLLLVEYEHDLSKRSRLHDRTMRLGCFG